MALSKVFNLVEAGTARTADVTSGTISTGGQTKAITGQTEDVLNRHAMVLISVATIDSCTITPYLQGRPTSDAAWYDLTPTTAFAAVTTAAQAVRRFEGPLPPELRLFVDVVGGTVDFGAEMVLGG